MMKLNCIVTDDEPIAREIVTGFVKAIAGLNLVATCNNAIETEAALSDNHVDILFIDIKMPKVSGLDLVRSLKKKPYVIFTTAYPTFAVDGFELDAVDYLLKPISRERFIKAVDKVYTRLNVNETPFIRKPESEPGNKYHNFFAKSSSGHTRILYDDILYIEGLENYIKIICEDKTVVTMNTMKSLEQSLPQDIFFRVHKSYIINIDKVENVQNIGLKIKNHIIPIGKIYKKNIIPVIKNKCLKK